MTRKIILSCIGFIILLAGYKFIQIRSAINQHKSFKLPPTTVNSYIVNEVNWSDTVSTFATLDSVEGATLSAELPGTVKSINFIPGSTVSAGDILLEFETAVEAADLKMASAEELQAQRKFDRAANLKKQGIASTLEFEEAETALLVSQAKVNSIKGVISRKQVVAPFSGTVGIRQVNVGDYVTAGTPIVSLYNLDRLFVNFSLPQKYINRVEKSQKIDVAMGDENALTTISGELLSVDPNIRAASRTFDLQGVIENTKGLFRPGMYVQLTLTLDDTYQTKVVPTTSVSYAPYGNSVFIINKDKQLEQRVVKLGQTRGNLISVLDGLNTGDEIVSTGVFKLRPGMDVIIDNSSAPNFSSSPNVTDS